MKLLIISTGTLPVPPVKGGAVEQLIDFILKKNESTKKYDITVASIFNEDALRVSKDYNNTKFEFIKISGLMDGLSRRLRYLINRIPNIYIGNFFISKLIGKLGDLNKFDIIVVQNAPEYGLILRRNYSGKMILHLHNDFLNSTTKLSNQIFDAFDNIFTLSKYVEKKVNEIKYSDKVDVLYNGIDLKNFYKSKYNIEEAREKYGITEKDFVIMYSGRLVPEKGVIELIQAFNNITSFTNIKLLIVGSSKYGINIDSKYIIDLKKEANLSKNKIIFTGYIPYDEIPKIYALADLGIAPSLCNEGFNLTVVEYMANSTPVIVSDRGGMKELVNSDCGIVVDSRNNFIENLTLAIEKLLNEKEYYYNLKYNSYVQSKNFSKEIFCEKFDELINSNS